MLQFGSITLNPQHEPPRPTIRPYWRALEDLSVLEPPTDDDELFGGDLMWEDIDVSVQQAPYGSPGTSDSEADLLLNVGPPPNLSDYLNRCNPEENPCEGRTFETMDSGTLEWTEESGDPDTMQYMTVDHKIVKAGGQVQSISSVTNAVRIVVSYFRGLLPSEFRMGPVEWTDTVHSYYECCPQALQKTVETTHAVWNKNAFHAIGFIAAAEAEEAMANQKTYMHSQKTVKQRYQAEGWLRHRTETRMEFAHWSYTISGHRSGGYDFSMFPVYKTSSRSETFTPLGGGRWLIYVTENNGVFAPVTTMVAGREEVVGTEYANYVNTYTIETDQAPPTVTCDVDPDNPGETCEQKAAREYQEALDAYNERVALHHVGIFNTPPTTLRQSLSTRRRIPVSMGQTLRGPAGSGIVVSLGYSGTRPLGSEPQDTVSLTLLSRLNNAQG